MAQALQDVTVGGVAWWKAQRGLMRKQRKEGA
jgi:hypothetical protein